MGKDYLPSDEMALRSWVANFSNLVSQWQSELGVPAEVTEELAVKSAAFGSALALAKDPETRGLRTVFLKDELKRELKTLVRQVARMVQGRMSVTDDQRQALGLTIRKTRAGSGVVPESAPMVTLSLAAGNKVRVTLSDADSHKRGRAAGAIGASIFSCVGELPSNRGGWKFEGNTNRMTIDIDIMSQTGSTVWICAQWFNRTSQSGPWSEPVCINVPSWGLMPKAA